MLFASADLVRRIERAECGLISSCIDAMSSPIEGLSRFGAPFAGGMAGYSGPGSPFNKIAGVGMGGPLDLVELEDLEGFYADRNTPVQVELASLADASVGEMLTKRGYHLVGFENVLGRALGEGADLCVRERPVQLKGRPESLEVRLSDESDFLIWLDTVVTGFAAPDESGVPSHESFARELMESLLTDMAAAEGLERYLAMLDGEPAGAGSMWLESGVALLNGASTLPNHRRRGVQGALLEHRLFEAAARGCDIAIVTTQPGSTSQKNVQRKGFN